MLLGPRLRGDDVVGAWGCGSTRVAEDGGLAHHEWRKRRLGGLGLCGVPGGLGSAGVDQGAGSRPIRQAQGRFDAGMTGRGCCIYRWFDTGRRRLWPGSPRTGSGSGLVAQKRPVRNRPVRRIGGRRGGGLTRAAGDGRGSPRTAEAEVRRSWSGWGARGSLGVLGLTMVLGPGRGRRDDGAQVLALRVRERTAGRRSFPAVVAGG